MSSTAAVAETTATTPSPEAPAPATVQESEGKAAEAKTKTEPVAETEAKAAEDGKASEAKAEEKPAEAKAAEKKASLLGSDEEVKAPEKPAEPEKAADEPDLEIKLPDHIVMDEKALEVFKPVAKELGLSSEAASRLAVLHAEVNAQRILAREEQGAKAIAEDPEFGGEKLAETVLAARSGMKFAAGEDFEALRNLLDADGYGNHPLLIKMFARIGRANRDDNSGTSGKAAPSSVPSREDLLREQYPTMFNPDGTRKTT